MIEIVDGQTGTNHISSEDLSALNTGLVGTPSCVFPWGSDFDLKVNSANSVTLGTGVGMVQGKRFWNKHALNLTIQNGSQGQRRHDLIVARYSTKTQSGNMVEAVDAVVVKGSSSSSPKDPYTDANDLALWRVPINGIAVEEPVRLQAPITPVKTLGDSVSQVKRDSGFIRLWGYSSYYITYRKVGDLVELYWYFPHNNNAAWSPDAALPPDVRPLDNIYASAIATDGNGTAQALQGLMWIGVNGTVESRIVNTRQGIYNRGHTSWIAAKV